jgi:hypothetical protein
MNKSMKKKSILTFILFLIIYAISGCDGIKTKLSREELKWINVYHKGDTLVFRSEKGELDTSFIIKREIFYPEYMPGEVHDKYLPQWGVVWYKNKNLKYHPDGYRMITIEKKHPKSNTFLSIDYLYASVLVPNLTAAHVGKYRQNKVYEFDTYSEKGKAEQPKKIFWHEEYGIVKYITHANVVWERVNYLKVN